MDFLPQGYENLKTEKPYWNISKMQPGDNRLRIVQRPIAGWIDWKDNKPFRYPPNAKPKAPFNAERPLRPFWTCYVWDYTREGLYVMEITQSSILKALTAFGSDSDWGDFTQYDIKIRKEGSGKETKYHVTPLPHKPLSEAIKKALEASPVRLEALYEGKDPWTDLDGFRGDFEPMQIEKKVDSIVSGGNLHEQMKANGIDAVLLDEYIQEYAAKRKNTPENVIESALMPQYFGKFKENYIKWLGQKQQAA